MRIVFHLLSGQIKLAPERREDEQRQDGPSRTPYSAVRVTQGRVCRACLLALSLALCVLSLLLGSASRAPAQITRGAGEGEQVTNIFLPAPRVLRQRVSKAREALAEERYSEAVELLGELLASEDMLSDGASRAGEQDYFLRGANEPGTQLSLKTEAQRLLGTMPDKGRELYELKFGADARQLLDRALESRDDQLLVEVARRYFHTDAGYEATMLLGRHYLDQGRPLAAALRFQRLNTSRHAWQRYEPELSVLLATCWLMADMPDRASQTIEALRLRKPAAKLRAGRAEISLFDQSDPTLQQSARAIEGTTASSLGRADRVIAWLRQVVGSELSGQSNKTKQWLLHCGNAARNAESAAGTPLMRARWRVQTANHPNDEALIRRGRKQYLEQGVPVIPTLQPLAVADTIIMRSPRHLLGIDFETGKRVWMFPWYEQPDEESLDEDRIRPGKESGSPRIVRLSRRVWDDAPFGHLSSDGERLFLLWGLDPPSSQGNNRVVQRFGVRQANSNGSAATNKLVALDLESEGKMLWIVGEEDGTDEPKLAGAFFLGPPLPLMGQLYVLAEINGEIRLVVLDAKTGALAWSQQLAHIDARHVVSDPTRRAVGASPSFSDGVLVCPTSSGAVVAVDVANRSLLWGYQYPLSGSKQHTNRRIVRRRLKPIGDRWADATVTINNGRALVTPAESNKLYCLDLVSGKPVWEPMERGELLYTGGVYENNAIMVGKREVKAISLDDGAVQWSCQLASGTPSGRGMLSGDHYYLPTTARRLLKIDLNKGAISQNIETDAVLGNLIAYQDQIISQNVDWLAAYYQTDSLRQKVAQRLEEDPDDTWALTHRAELLRHDGKHSEALKMFQRAYELRPSDNNIRGSLVQSLLSALRDDFETNAELAARLEKLIAQPEERARFCRWMAMGLKEQGKYDKAMRYLIRLASLNTNGSLKHLDPDNGAMIRVNDQLQVHRDRWLQIQIDEVLSHASGPAAAAIDQMARAHLDQVLDDGSLLKLKKYVQRFGNHPAGSEAKMRLARRLIEDGHLLQAEMALMELQDAEDPATAATATALLAQMLLDHNKLPEAAICVQQLRGPWRETDTLEGPTGQQVANRLMDDESLAAAVNGPSPWPYGRCETTKRDQRARSSQTRVYPIEMAEIHGPFPPYHRLVYNRNRRCLVLSDATGQTKQTVMLGEKNRLRVVTNLTAGRASARGHLLMVNVGFNLMAVDTLQANTSQSDPVLWRDNLLSNLLMSPNQRRRTMPRKITRNWGPARVVLTDNSRRPIGMTGPITRHGVIYQKMRDLICADPLTGETRWVRSNLEPGSDIFGDEDYTFVVGPESTTARVFNTADGTEVEQRAVTSRTERWITSGRNVVTCRSDGRKLTVRCFDPWEQKDQWKLALDDDTQCWRPSRDEIALFEPDGKLLIVDLLSGDPIVDCQLEAIPSLNRLYVLASPTDYTVIASGDNPNPNNNTPRIYGSIGGSLCPQINGHIHSIDRQTGKPRYNKATKVYGYCLPLNQAPKSPALVFLRNKRTRISTDSPRTTYKASVLFVDKRDGRKLYSAERLDRTLSYAIEANPQQRTVLLKTNKHEFEMKFTDKPLESAEPFQMKVKETTGTKVRKSVGKIAGALLDAITKGKEEKEQEQEKRAEEEGKEKNKDKE